MPYQRLQVRLDRLQEQHPTRPRSSVDWTLLTDAELEELGEFAVRAAASSSRRAFLASLSPDDTSRLGTIATRVNSLP
jgi:hypothetical protein